MNNNDIQNKRVRSEFHTRRDYKDCKEKWKEEKCSNSNSSCGEIERCKRNFKENKHVYSRKAFFVPLFPYSTPKPCCENYTGNHMCCKNFNDGYNAL